MVPSSTFNQEDIMENYNNIMQIKDRISFYYTYSFNDWPNSNVKNVSNFNKLLRQSLTELLSSPSSLRLWLCCYNSSGGICYQSCLPPYPSPMLARLRPVCGLTRADPVGQRPQQRGIYGRCRIGNRDVVGYGINGCCNYKDDAHFPFPAVRFRENTPAYVALKEKEKGCWKLLCCEEKKTLYRASFCQTFAEFQHPTGQWKGILGMVLFCLSFPLWVAMFNHYYVWEPLPASLAQEAQKQQLRRMIELRVNPIDGISSLWNYEHDCWEYQRPLTAEEQHELDRSVNRFTIQT